MKDAAACLVLIGSILSCGETFAQQQIDLPNKQCRTIYEMKYRTRPPPKIFFSHYSTTFHETLCNWWVRADATEVSKFATVQEAIAYTRANTQQFVLLDSQESNGVPSGTSINSGAIDPKPTCEGYPVGTIGRGLLGTVCRCDYGGPIHPELPGWWATVPNKPDAPVLACSPPK